MTRLSILALVLLAGSACSVPSRIVGGWPVSLEDWNFIVQVDFWSLRFFGWSQSCAANILNEKFLLSAAHCFDGPVSLRRIRSGAQMRNIGGIIHRIEYYRHHPSHDLDVGMDGDITILKIIEPLVFSPVVGQARIPRQGAQVPVGAPVKYAGWGHTVQGGEMSPELLETQVYTADNDLCRELYAELPLPEDITQNMICTIYPGGGRDACQGDSGGPLTYANILVGIVSFGHGCANETYPGVSAAVSPYSDWIVENVQN